MDDSRGGFDLLDSTYHSEPSPLASWTRSRSASYLLSIRGCEEGTPLRIDKVREWRSQCRVHETATPAGKEGVERELWRGRRVNTRSEHGSES